MIASQPDRSDPLAPASSRGRVDLALRFETPENVVLTYRLAGPMPRAGAYLIDLLVRGVVLTVLYLILLCSAMVTPHAAMGAAMILSFVFTWFYYTLFEAYWKGRTPGKYLVGLRVVKDKGYPITFLASFGRNLARSVDALGVYTFGFNALGVYAVGFVIMLLSPRFQRLGDLLAQTVVVQERTVRLPREPIILDRIEPLPRAEVSGPPPARGTLTLIDEFLGRRNFVSISRGHEIARPLARALAERLNYGGDWQYLERYPMAFLARVYVTFLRRDEDDEAPRFIRGRARGSRSNDPHAVGPGLYE